MSALIKEAVQKYQENNEPEIGSWKEVSKRRAELLEISNAFSLHVDLVIDLYELLGDPAS